MANQYYNISYDPAKQGYSTDTWRTMYGDVSIVSGQLQLNKASILHYGDILRGDAYISINIGAPVAGDNSKFGLTQYSKGAYTYFQISDGVLTAEVSNGINSRSSAIIPWLASWTDTDTEFRIKWEAGMVSFFIDGQIKAIFDDSSSVDALATAVIPGCPMSIYIASDSPDLMLVDYIIVKSIQSYVISTGNSNSSFEVVVKESDKLNISDVPVMKMVDMAINKADILNITEASTVIRPELVATVSTNDSLDISESNTTDTPA